MSFSKKLKYYLVHSLSYSNKGAQELIDKGNIRINDATVIENCLIDACSEITINGHVVRLKKIFVYIKFYKPIGYQSSLNGQVDNSLAHFFTDYEGLAIAGRLDKQSEGLLLLSNDGKWIEKLCNPHYEKEKEYLVTLNKNPDSNFIHAFKNGVRIGNYLTKSCACAIISDNRIKVVLKEGKNRQIRRMCKVLGYNVLQLKRTRIAEIHLIDLSPGDLSLIDNTVIAFI